MQKSQRQAQPTKPLSAQEQEQKTIQQKRNGQLVCSIMMMSLGVISSPKLLAAFFNKDRYPKQFQSPNCMTFIACVGGFLFLLTVLTISLRIITRKAVPAERRDPPSIQSINQAIKNAIIYTLVFLGLYCNLLRKAKKQSFTLQIAPFVFLGTLVFQFGLRVLEFLVDVKGIRYLAQAITIFMLTMFTIQFLA